MVVRKTPVYTFYIVLVFIAYTLPWIYAIPQVLALNAYDLAEWASLHPVVRNQNPALMTTLWLRLTLTFLTFLLAAWTTQTSHPTFRILLHLSIAIVIIMQLPPLEILNTPADPNYLQQLGLALVSALGSVAIRRSNKDLRQRISLIISIVAGISAWLGFQQAHTLLSQFGIESTPGLGMVLFLSTSGLYWFYSAAQIITNRTSE